MYVPISWLKEYVDVTLSVPDLAERITLGKSVAEYKFQSEQQAYMDTGGDAAQIQALLVNRERESEVIELSRHLARIYEFDEAQAADVFAWIIRTTIRVEVSYLQTRVAAAQGDG